MTRSKKTGDKSESITNTCKIAKLDLQVGDEIRWQWITGSWADWRVLEPPVPATYDYKWKAKAICIGIGRVGYPRAVVGDIQDVVFHADTVEGSDWKFVDDELTRFVRQVHAEQITMDELA
jgi:hypothetical protein